MSNTARHKPAETNLAGDRFSDLLGACNYRVSTKHNYNTFIISWIEKKYNKARHNCEKKLDSAKMSFVRLPGGRYSLLSQLSFGAIAFSGLFTHRFAAYAFLAGVANSASQYRNGLCANHAFFGSLTHCFILLSRTVLSQPFISESGRGPDPQ
jgi:hypothetical protein